ncbi:unnamed protein product [Rotaria magnacalcarata]|nr:unnamed protein product [Rotaria magnacalcarata]
MRINIISSIYFRRRNPSHLLYFVGIIIFISLSYLLVHGVYPKTFSNNVIIIHQPSNVSLSNVSSSDKDRSNCMNDGKSSIQPLSSLVFRSQIINYLGFILRSGSVFYCSVPKVATRTFLQFITYLHIRDDLIPLLTHKSTLSNWNFQQKLNPFDFNDLNQILSYPMKNTSHPSLFDSVSILNLLLSRLMDFKNKSVIDFDIWSIYQRQIFPLIRPESLSNVSLLFSSNFTRAIFVRHPLERLASAYVDKVASLTNEPFSLYDTIRRAICRNYSSFYLTGEQHNYYLYHTRIPKNVEEPCHKVVPKFEHFVDHITSSSMIADVHWYPYSKLCYACLFKYNFIGKYETIEQDLERLLSKFGLESKHWNNENYFRTGKTKEYYKSMYANFNNQLLCNLKYVYENDFTLFDYKMEDYLTDKKNLSCSPEHRR